MPQPSQAAAFHLHPSLPAQKCCQQTETGVSGTHVGGFPASPLLEGEKRLLSQL